MKTVFLTSCGKLCRFLGGLAVRLLPAVQGVLLFLLWVLASALRGFGLVLKSLGKGGSRRKAFLGLLQSLAKTVMGGAILAYSINQASLNQVVIVILGGLVVWLLATHSDDERA